MTSWRRDLWPGVACPVIGVLHLPALPGSPGWSLQRDELADRVLQDAKALAEGGVDGILLENFNDKPFYRTRVPHHVVATMTALAVEVRRLWKGPLGINVLRNDARSALAIAAACQGNFIRVNVLAGAQLTDQGIIQGCAATLLRLRRWLNADSIHILADVRVKHAAPLAERGLAEEVQDLIDRAGADALLVTGSATGKPADPDMLQQLHRMRLPVRVLAASGVTPETVGQVCPACDGLIVGSYFKSPEPPYRVEAERVGRLVAAVREAQGA